MRLLKTKDFAVWYPPNCESWVRTIPVAQRIDWTRRVPANRELEGFH